jgi:hypothetical protein
MIKKYQFGSGHVYKWIVGEGIYPWYTSNKELGHGMDYVWHVASMKPMILMGVNIDEIQRRIVEMVVIAH